MLTGCTQSLSLVGDDYINKKRRQALRLFALEQKSQAVLHEVVRARDPHYVDKDSGIGFTITYLP